MFSQGLRTVIYKVPDLVKAKAWYSVAFNVLPYFDESFYVGFNIGGYELGLDPDATNVKTGSNVITYWGVAYADAAFKSLIEKGAQEHEAVHEVGEGILVGSVYDPFGNIIGIIENPFFRATT
ncbi:MAG: glyoxalase/bleomycin resistance/extradiol dioxygenase family protein [Cytophagales bacterium CG18_big_fil_WC_8_21_14_2_50_42_9]|nr:MAG: glyoxalase/bleomycin resistance/extradiol dioxygenase family protein [Cytophagales bacterium CG18_big_fil_WC_8_21_14_2_50_42_9]